MFGPVGEKKPTQDSVAVQIHCPECDFANAFWGRKDTQGNILEHFGRRCHGLIEASDGQDVDRQCTYRFRFKCCPYCHQENDIAARQFSSTHLKS